MRLLRWFLVFVLLLALLFGTLRLASLWWLGRIGWYSGETLELSAEPARDFHWPYRLYIPASLVPGEPARLWLRPNNTGVGVHDDFAVHHADALALLEVSRWQAERLRAVVLVPSFPRPKSEWEIYTHALDRDTITGTGPLARLDLQLLAMADHASEVLRARGLTVCRRAFIDGFSASGMFASRFTLLHPDRVLAAGVGAPGGWPMVPASSYEGERLGYPLGVGDYQELFGVPFSREALRATPMLFYLGEEDENDAVPYRDGFDPEQEKLIFKHFGARPADRWSKAEALFEGLPVTFRIYPGEGHNETYTMRDALLSFFAAQDDRGACAAGR